MLEVEQVSTAQCRVKPPLASSGWLKPIASLAVGLSAESGGTARSTLRSYVVRSVPETYLIRLSLCEANRCERIECTRTLNASGVKCANT